MNKESSLLDTEVLFCQDPVSKNHFIVNLYGLVDEVSSGLNFTLYYAQNNEAAEELVNVCEKLNVFLSQKAIPDMSLAYFHPYVEIDMTPWNKMCADCLSAVGGIEKDGFVLLWKNELSLWINESRTRVRRIERFMISHNNTDCWLEMIQFFNQMSDFLFKMGVLLNG